MVGSPTVLINYMQACRMGDIVIEKPGLALGPPDPIVMGCPTVLIGNVGMGGGSSPLAIVAKKAKAAAVATHTGGNPSKYEKKYEVVIFDKHVIYNKTFHPFEKDQKEAGTAAE